MRRRGSRQAEAYAQRNDGADGCARMVIALLFCLIFLPFISRAPSESRLWAAWLWGMLCATPVWLLYRPLRALFRQGQRLELAVDDDGLTDRISCRRLRRVGWGEVTGVTLEAELATVHTTAGSDLTLTPAVKDWLRLVSRIQQQLDLSPAEAAGPDASTAEAWLLLPPGASRSWRYRPAPRRWSSTLWLSAMQALIWGTILPYSPFGGAMFCFWVGLFVAECLDQWWHRGRLVADGKGLRMITPAGTRQVPWASMRHVERTCWWRLSTADGDVQWLPRTGDDLLIRTIRQAIAANQASPVLPRMVDGLDGGLSRAADPSVDLSRAISRAESGEPGA